MKYEVMYDYDNGCDESRNIREEFDGNWTELQNFIKELRESGCYNIDAAAVDGE